jgi:hypothetical protein
MIIRIGCIVEGHGDVEAVPILVRRLAHEIDPELAVETPRPIRVPKDRLLKTGELERHVELAARNTRGEGGVLVLVDSDDDCPAELGPLLLSRVRKARADVPAAVVLAKREFEGWLLAGAGSLRGRRGLPNDLEGPEDPESVRGAKEWLSRKMPRFEPYRETLHQAPLTAALDFALARRARSFARCEREIVRLCRLLRDKRAAG